MARKTVKDILNKKKNRQKITMLTAYDYPFGLLVDQAGVDIILVGDSLANVVLGLRETRQVTMNEMIHHAKAVNRAVTQAFLVGDMPYESYQEHPDQAAQNARRFIEEAGCNAVKLEWFDRCLEVAGNIVKAGVPVMGHVGLTPQTVKELGGFKVQGQDADSAKGIIENAKALEQKGCFCLVLECIPDKIAEMITEQVSIPTIGIGAGPSCDGQVLVIHDVLGLFEKFQPKFVKKYGHLAESITGCVRKFKQEVESGIFPDKNHSYRMSQQEYEKLKKNEFAR